MTPIAEQQPHPTTGEHDASGLDCADCGVSLLERPSKHGFCLPCWERPVDEPVDWEEDDDFDPWWLGRG